MAKRNRKLTIGEEFTAWPGDSESTLRSMIDVLERYGKRRFVDEIKVCRDALADFEYKIDAAAESFERAIDVSCESLTAWSQESNSYLWFGVNENYPESFGFWVDVDSAVSDADWQGDNLGELPCGFSGLAVTVNDHGNVSAYRVTRGRARELFAVV